MGREVRKVRDASADDVLESAFADYVAAQWQRLTPSHTYSSARGGAKTAGTSKTFASLEAADKQYEFNGASRASTITLLEGITARLHKALRSEDAASHALHHLCLEILEWGGVEGTSSAWLRQRCDENALAEAIRNAVHELAAPVSPKQRGAASVFMTGTPMNSGLTKIFALAAPDRIVIYDGRVGAGLGLLARRFLEATTGRAFRRKPLEAGDNEVPEFLRWGWGDGQATQKQKGRRDPSKPGLKFPALHRTPPHADLRHAEYAWRASRLLRNVRSRLPSSSGVKLADLERALFMIGYDVRDRLGE
jgi:hypothetical protein